MTPIFNQEAVRDFTRKAIDGNSQHVEEWLARGMPVDSIGPTRVTALYAATLAQQQEIVATLLKAGANPNQLVRPLGRADTDSALNAACLRGYHGIIEELIRGGANPKVVDDGLNTALHRLLEAWGMDQAAEGQDVSAAMPWLGRFLDSITLLADAGAPLNQRTENQHTALSIAIDNSLPLEIVKLLLDKGADPDLRLEGGCTAMHLAARRGNAPALRLLAAHGADVDATDDRLRTALFCFSDAAAAQELVALGARLDHVEIHGMNPLSYWIDLKSRKDSVDEQVSFLIDAGCDLGQKDYTGRTAQDIAVAKGRTEISMLISAALARGAMQHARHRAGASPA